MGKFKSSLLAVVFSFVLASCGGGDGGSPGGGTPGGKIDAAFGSLDVDGLDSVFSGGRTFSPTGGVTFSSSGLTIYSINSDPEGYPESFTPNHDIFTIAFYVFDGNLQGILFSYFNTGASANLVPDGYNYDINCGMPNACSNINFSGASAQFLNAEMAVLTDSSSSIPNFATSPVMLDGTISW